MKRPIIKPSERIKMRKRDKHMDLIKKTISQTFPKINLSVTDSAPLIADPLASAH